VVSSLSVVVAMSGTAFTITTCLLLFLGWRLTVLDRQQQDHHDEFRHFQLEVRREHQRRLDALEAHVSVIEASLREIAGDIDSVTP
jgi:hypothetical protein